LEGKYKTLKRDESNLYLWALKSLFFRLNKKYPQMKNKFLAGFLLIVMAVAIASCATSRKYGCPSASKTGNKNLRA
jgi:hypothetical protein